MKTLLIIAVIAVIVIVIKACVSGSQLGNDSSRPNVAKPTSEKLNDKIIIVNNANHNDMKKALTEFCNIYNKNDYAALPRLWQLSANSFAVTFPYDVDFATYCFAVNFLKYPMDIKWDARVYAWCTAHAGDQWITDKSTNKVVMLYLAVNDKEYDNVFLTTQDNIGYKLGFAVGHETQLLSTPNEMYTAPAVDIETLKSMK